MSIVVLIGVLFLVAALYFLVKVSIAAAIVAALIGLIILAMGSGRLRL